MNFNHNAIKRFGRSYKWDAMLEAFPETEAMDIMPFTVAEMEWQTDPIITHTLQTYLAEDILGYTKASKTYTKAVCQWMHNHYHLDIHCDDIITTPGVITAIKMALEVMTTEGDGVILLTPVYHSFFKMLEAVHRVPATSDLINQNGIYSIDFEDLEAKFKDPANTVMIMCHPHNPIGRVWTRDELERIHALSLQYNVPVISDEIHADLTLSGHQHVSYGTLDPQAIICTSVSKTFNLAGLKISNIIIKDERLRHQFVNHGERYGTIGANALAIQAAEVAYRKGQPWLDQALQEIEANAAIVTERFAATDIIVSPLEATYLIWMDFQEVIKKDPALLQRLESEAYFFASDGEAFGANGAGFLRMNLAGPQRYIVEACDRVLEIVNKL